MSNQYLIGMGTSHPVGRPYLVQAIERIRQLDVRVISQSPFEQSGGVGTDDALVFWNAVIYLETHMSPVALWFQLAALEIKLGRIRTKVNGPRTIDLDLLFWSMPARRDAFITLPHPRFFERQFARDLAVKALRGAGVDAFIIKNGSP